MTTPTSEVEKIEFHAMTEGEMVTVQFRNIFKVTPEVDAVLKRMETDINDLISTASLSATKAERGRILKILDIHLSMTDSKEVSKFSNIFKSSLDSSQ